MKTAQPAKKELDHGHMNNRTLEVFIAQYDSMLPKLGGGGSMHILCILLKNETWRLGQE